MTAKTVHPHSYRMFFEHGTAQAFPQINTRRFRNERGIFFIQWNRRGTFTCELQVRLGPTDPWSTYLLFNDTLMASPNQRRAVAVFHFPFVRAEITAATGSQLELSAWYID